VPFYQRLGDVPRKRHIQFRDNGTLLTEEVMGMEGFVGMESILYHLQSPCRVMKIGGFEEIKRDEWVPDAHAHRHFKTYDIDAEGDEITGRRLLMWNSDVEISLARPKEQIDDLRQRPVQGRRLHRHPAWHDVSIQAGGRAALPRLRNARPDRDPEALPESVRPDARRRAVLPPRHPSAG
jgi:hypothetical protein